MTRNEAREILMQILYEMDTGRSMEGTTAERLASERLSGNHTERGIRLLKQIIDEIDGIDEAINRCSKSWKTRRMPKVDLAIMRLALGELKFCEDIPEAVTVNEAINLARKFSTVSSSKFVHGVLGAVIKTELNS